MKKSIFALLMALMLCLCAGATAETVSAFPFTAQEFADVFALENTGTITADEDGAMVIEFEGGSPVLVAYDASGACTGLQTDISIALSESDSASSQGELMGASAYQMIYLARYVELGKDEDAAFNEVSDIVSGFTDLMNGFSDEDYSAAITAPVTKELEVCGHPASMTIGFDLAEMALTMTFAYLP